MKKLMIVAAGALIASSSYAVAVRNCHATNSMDCAQIVYKITASGKTVVETEKDDSLYSAITKIKVSKGALVFFGQKDIDELTGEEDCCYPSYSLYLPVKVGKTTYKYLFSALDITNGGGKWSVFGKGLDKLEASMENNKSKKAKLESDLGLFFTDIDSEYDDDLPGLDEVTGVTLAAAAFGKASYKYSYKNSGTACAPCEAESGALTPGNYSGWFAGFCDADDASVYCLTCECPTIRIFGGTWKAKFDKAKSVKNGWKSAAAYAFGSSTAAAMQKADVE